MNNLPKFIALEKVVQTVKHGNIALELKVRDGAIVGVVTNGSKKTLYNQSTKDINTNNTAFEHILKRINQQLESQITGELVFKITSSKDKIKSVEITSEQTIT